MPSSEPGVNSGSNAGHQSRRGNLLSAACWLQQATNGFPPGAYLMRSPNRCETDRPFKNGSMA